MLFLSFPYYDPHTDEHFKYCLPEREDVFELLPFELGDYEFVKDSNLGEPDDVVKEVVVV